MLFSRSRNDCARRATKRSRPGRSPKGANHLLQQDLPDRSSSGSSRQKQAKPFIDGDVWRRTVTVSQILSLYRGIYTPAPGSPLIDAGDPSDDTGGARNTDIGAVGAGNAHPDDQFGRFGRFGP